MLAMPATSGGLGTGVLEGLRHLGPYSGPASRSLDAVQVGFTATTRHAHSACCQCGDLRPALLIRLCWVPPCSTFPLFTHTASILLQTTPRHLKAGLERCRREVTTIPGVLECKDEHFWTQAPGMCGGC